MKAIRILAISSIALSALTVPAFAQSNAPAADEDSAASKEADIVVTARRVAERLQDVPLAVTAIQGESLSRLGIVTAIDLRQVVSGLSVTAAAGRPATPLYSIRGQRGGDQVFTQDPPVNAYLDEVLITPIAGSNASLFDLENVQVLKGPQGTLFGRNTTGGAILYTSARPKDELSAKIAGGVANYNSFTLSGHVNVPISDAVKLRVAADYRKQGGFGEVLAGPEIGKDVMGFRQFAGRVSLQLQPSDTVESLTVVGYSKWEDQAGPAFRILDTPRATGSANAVFNTNFVVPGNQGLLSGLIARQRANGDYNIESGELNGGRSEIWTATNSTTIELSDNVNLKNIFGYRHLDTWDAVDYDGTILPILAATNTARANTFSNETQIQGKGLDGKLDYIFGVYFFDQRGIEGTGSPFLDVRNQSPGTIAFGGAARMQFVRIKNRSLSGFGQVGYRVSDAITLNAGLRYTIDERSSTASTGTVSRTVFNNNNPVPTSCGFTGANGLPLPATFEGCQIAASKSFGRPSWLLGVDWKVDSDTLVYITSRNSYRSGGFQSRPFDNLTAAQTFDPETVTDIELGLKRDWSLGGNVGLRTNIAAYHQWYNNVQRSTVTQTPVGVGNVVNNAAKARIKGFEFESSLRFGNLATLALNYAYIDAGYQSYPTFIFNNAIPPVRFPIDKTGFPFPYVPKHQLNGSLTVTPDVGDIGDLTITLNGFYQSRIFLGEDYFDQATLSTVVFNAPVPADAFFSQKPYALFNGRVELGKIGGSGFTAAIWARNLFDKRYVDSGTLFQNSIGFGGGIYGPPRTFGIDVSMAF